MTKLIEEADAVVACNINFSSGLLRKAKELGKLTATDVHVLSSIEDSFNSEFMEYADILFLSDEQLPCEPEKFHAMLKTRYSNQIIVIGMGSEGAMIYERSEDKIYKVDAVRCEGIVNTVGAGDALFSCFLHYYLKGCKPVTALMKAEIFASEKIKHNGAANGFCDEKEIETIFLNKKIIVHEMEIN